MSELQAFGMLLGVLETMGVEFETYEELDAYLEDLDDWSPGEEPPS